jgi:hypothetical protein
VDFFLSPCAVRRGVRAELSGLTLIRRSLCILVKKLLIFFPPA